ncbi:MAG: hypothetical protein PWP27_2230 [Clostridiales bacterium]|jgi:YHS domain-containing protein|nr:hypothetical protein [Clostridiales bacterium]
MELSGANILYFIFVGMMMFMMFRRGGCCGGHSHGGHGTHRDHNGHCSSDTNQANHQEVNMVQDPVCKMYINPNTAVKATIDGQTYYFCSESCKNKFHKQQLGFMQ